jgi:hypothetical protein
MNTRKLGLIGIIAAMAIPAYASAAEHTHRCALHIDDAQRLGCYDAEYGKPVPAPARSGAIAAPSAPPVAAPAVIGKPEVAKSKAPVPKSFTASIKSLALLHDGRFKATFDSGQVWTQIEPDKAVILMVGDQVTVKKAMLGSFMLVTPAGILTRVKQVE